MEPNTTELFVAIAITTLVILVLVIAIILTLFITAKKQAQAKLDFERELRQVENEVSEHVLGQMAQELHDNIGQELTALNFQVQNQKLEYPQLSNSFKPIEIHLAHIDKQLRLLSRTLNYDYLGHIGLYAAIQTLAERLNALKRVAITCQLPNQSTSLNKNQELMVFRVLQEIAQNTLRHAGATHLQIKVNSATPAFDLVVTDNGKGFDTDLVLKSKNASGLKNILKRIKLANLQIDLKSEIGKGTTYRIYQAKP